MPVNVAKALRDKLSPSGVSSAIRDYERRIRSHGRAGSETEESEHVHVNNLYYDLVTDFFEFGWGRSFHFAPRVPGESFKDSLVRHEQNMARALGLKPGMVVADLGCAGATLEHDQASISTRRPISICPPAAQCRRACTPLPTPRADKELAVTH